jgi:hypothetical protein
MGSSWGQPGVNLHRPAICVADGSSGPRDALTVFESGIRRRGLARAADQGQVDDARHVMGCQVNVTGHVMGCQANIARHVMGCQVNDSRHVMGCQVNNSRRVMRCK